MVLTDARVVTTQWRVEGSLLVLGTRRETDRRNLNVEVIVEEVKVQRSVVVLRSSLLSLWLLSSATSVLPRDLVCACVAGWDWGRSGRVVGMNLGTSTSAPSAVTVVGVKCLLFSSGFQAVGGLGPVGRSFTS